MPSVSALLFDLALIVLIARAAGLLAARIGQPPVIGEILSGMLFGATLFHGAIARTLFPGQIRPLLGAWANIGVAMFMFLVGLELDRAAMRGNVRVALSVSMCSVLIPFGLGVVCAFSLAGPRAHHHHLSAGFVLYFGVALSVTAFPVLARILRDRRLLDSPLGALACTCAGMADVIAWSLLAGVMAISRAAGGPWRLSLLPPYLAFLLFVVRPVLRRYLDRYPASRPGGQAGTQVLAPLLVGMLLSAAAANWLGLSFIFGAFFFGVVVPKEALAGQGSAIVGATARFNDVLLLPVFFVIAGLPVDLSAIGYSGLADLGLILLAAAGGKLGGAFLAARFNGFNGRQSSALAVLMNTRGLTELVILNAGRQLGLLDNRLYTLMVTMALVTTAMTGPLLGLIRPDPALTGAAHPAPGAGRSAVAVVPREG